MEVKTLRDAIDDYIVEVCAAYKWNVQQAAQALNVSRALIYRRLTKKKIQVNKQRREVRKYE